MASILAAALPYLLGSGGAATGGLSGMGGLANALGGGTFGSMAGSAMGGGMQGATQGSGLMGLLSGGGMHGGMSSFANGLMPTSEPKPETNSGLMPSKGNYPTFVNGLGRL